jgi:hypothetical protein
MVNTTNNNTAIFGESKQLIGNTKSSQNTTKLYGEVSTFNLYGYSSLRCSGARLISSFDPALPSVKIYDTFTFSTGVAIFENKKQEEPLLIY